MEWDRNTGDNIDEQKFSLDRHSQSSDALLSWLTVISIELTKRQRVPFLTGCKKHRLTRVTPEDIGLDRVYIILSSSLSLSLLFPRRRRCISSLYLFPRVFGGSSPERERERSGERGRERGRQTKKERKKKKREGGIVVGAPVPRGLQVCGEIKIWAFLVVIGWTDGRERTGRFPHAA